MTALTSRMALCAENWLIARQTLSVESKLSAISAREFLGASIDTTKMAAEMRAFYMAARGETEGKPRRGIARQRPAKSTASSNSSAGAVKWRRERD